MALKSHPGQAFSAAEPDTARDCRDLRSRAVFVSAQDPGAGYESSFAGNNRSR